MVEVAVYFSIEDESSSQRGKGVSKAWGLRMDCLLLHLTGPIRPEAFVPLHSVDDILKSSNPYRIQP